MSASILVVEDDKSIQELLREIVLSEEWAFKGATNGQDALHIIESNLPDLIILDILLPELDGFEVCRRIRERFLMPIIVLSALKDTINKVRCFELGANDYVTKPFAVEELIARMKVALGQNIHKRDASSNRTSGPITFDLVSRRVYAYDRELVLSKTEYNLLKGLIENAGYTLTYEHLLSKVWGPEYVDENEYLYTYIKHLRQKIEPDPKHPQYIICEPKFGYRFVNQRQLGEIPTKIDIK